MDLNLEFCSLEELSTDPVTVKAKKYIPSQIELIDIRKFAEGFNEPGIVKIFNHDGMSVVSSKTYGYYEGRRPEAFIIFNAEVAWHDDDDDEEIELMLSLSSLDIDIATIRVPIQHAYFKHIFWHDELPELLDMLEEFDEEWPEEILEEEDDDGFICC